MRKISLMAIAASSGAMAIAAIATPVFAQSSGTLDFDKDIVVTGSRDPKGIAGVVSPDTSKAKGELTQAWIEHQAPGASVNDMVNYLPGVSFQSTDPYGSTTGFLSIRGFDGTRISETFDGMTLNDDGGYSLYSGQMLDSEVIDSVTVNLGTTDVDSPTTSASGSTINFISHKPSDDFHARLSGSAGTDKYMRIFGMLETGAIGPWGTKAWISASTMNNRSPFNNYSKIHKDQFNAKVYQPLGSNGDFLSLAAFYVRVRNNFAGQVPLSNIALAANTGAGLTYRPGNYKDAYYTYAGCQTAAAVAGSADAVNSCGSAFDYRANPANLANIRGSARITLADKLVLNVDPSYQFTKANGGGTVSGSEGTSGGSVGFINGSYYLGKDLNGDGDTLDTVRLLAPSETKTHRIAVTSSLRYEFSTEHALRLAYAFSRSVITQSGELTYLNSNGSPLTVFPVNNPITDSSGSIVQKRNTESIAMLNQVSGEYRGKFLNDNLVVTLGVRAPFMHRQLTNYCFTRSLSASVSCVNGASATAYATANPTYGKPQTRTFDYSAVLPNAGATLKLGGGSQMFANYSKGMSAPMTTSLYQAFWPNISAAASTVSLEKTDNFDVGYRYNDRRLSAQLDFWYTHFVNRLGSAFNPNDNTSIYTNLGNVNRYGFDGNVSYRVTPHVTAYVFGSWLHSKISSNVTGLLADGTNGTLYTAGKFESAVPVYTVGGRLQGESGPVTLGVQVKRTGPRYVNDQNTPNYSYNNAGVTNGTVVYGAQAPAYTVVDLDARLSLKAIGLNDRSFFQLNVTNLFNKYYVGGFSGTFNNQMTYTGTYTTTQLSSPRAIMGSISMAY